MPWGDLAAHLVVTVAATALTALAGLGLAPLLGRPRPRPRPALLAVGAWAAIAAPNLALPLNPVPGAGRNLLVALIALVTATWLGIALTGGQDDEVRPATLAGSLGFVLAAALIAVIPGSLRPQAIGSSLLGAEAPVKVAGAVLAVLSLPAVTGALGDRLDQLRPQLSAALAFPYAALLASEFSPPPDDLAGALRWLALVALMLLATAGLSAALADPGRRRRYHRRILPAAAAVLVATAVFVALI